MSQVDIVKVLTLTARNLGEFIPYRHPGAILNIVRKCSYIIFHHVGTQCYLIQLTTTYVNSSFQRWSDQLSTPLLCGSRLWRGLYELMVCSEKHRNGSSSTCRTMFAASLANSCISIGSLLASNIASDIISETGGHRMMKMASP